MAPLVFNQLPALLLHRLTRHEHQPIRVGLPFLEVGPDVRTTLLKVKVVSFPTIWADGTSDGTSLASVCSIHFSCLFNLLEHDFPGLFVLDALGNLSDGLSHKQPTVVAGLASQLPCGLTISFQHEVGVDLQVFFDRKEPFKSLIQRQLSILRVWLV